MRRGLAGGLALVCAAAAAHTNYLLADELVCDGDVCIRGWLIHDPHNNEIELDARLQKTAAPGVVILSLVGVTPGAQHVTTSLSVEVRGQFSEILHAKIIPQWPFETLWEVEAMRFEPAEAADPPL